MSIRRATEPLSSVVWLALWGSLTAVASCSNGGDVYLGRATSPASGTGGGGGSGTGECGTGECANHSGMKIFDADAPGSKATFDRAADMPSGSDANREPAIVYPSHETMFPINVRNLRHEWTDGKNTLFELKFEGTNSTVWIYTKDTSFVPNDEQWDWIAESNRGGAVTLTVRGLDLAAASSAFRSQPITLNFSAQAVDGAIYYWSTAGKGVMRALISEANPQKFYPAPDAAPAEAEKCVGCHTLSRDGKHLAVTLGTELRVVSVPGRDVELPVSSGVGGASGTTPMKGDKGTWSAFSPDGSRILVASGGKMTLLDATTGAAIGPADAIAMPGQFATHPDWSALGDYVAFTVAGKGDERGVEGGSIWRTHVNGDAFDTPEPLIPSGPGENNFFPVWSPDSRYLAYVNTSGKSQDSPAATVRLFDVNAKSVIELLRLNQQVNNQDLMKMGNSMPTWAPSTGSGPFWLAFSSIRPYASVRPKQKKSDQIWIAAIDPSLKDPGYPAFWAPFQSISQSNHRAFWTHSDQDRLSFEVCGDLFDNDGDGSADEADCVTCMNHEDEACSDGIDNDCDGVIDDCATEDCMDGIDNDGDGRIDAADPFCAP